MKEAFRSKMTFFMTILAQLSRQYDEILDIADSSIEDDA